MTDYREKIQLTEPIEEIGSEYKQPIYFFTFTISKNLHKKKWSFGKVQPIVLLFFIMEEIIIG